MSPFLADSGTELVVPPSTCPETVSAVCESSAEELAQLCKEIRSEFGGSDCYKDEDTPEEEYVGKLLNIKVKLNRLRKFCVLHYYQQLLWYF